MQAEELARCTFRPAITRYKLLLSRPLRPTGLPGPAEQSCAPGAGAVPVAAAPNGSSYAAAQAVSCTAARPEGAAANQPGSPSFESYLERVLFELQQMETVEGAPAVWGLQAPGAGGSGGGAGEGAGDGAPAIGLPADNPA